METISQALLSPPLLSSSDIKRSSLYCAAGARPPALQPPCSPRNQARPGGRTTSGPPIGLPLWTVLFSLTPGSGPFPPAQSLMPTWETVSRGKTQQQSPGLPPFWSSLEKPHPGSQGSEAGGVIRPAGSQRALHKGCLISTPRLPAPPRRRGQSSCVHRGEVLAFAKRYWRQSQVSCP